MCHEGHVVDEIEIEAAGMRVLGNICNFSPLAKKLAI